MNSVSAHELDRTVRVAAADKIELETQIEEPRTGQLKSAKVNRKSASFRDGGGQASQTRMRARNGTAHHDINRAALASQEQHQIFSELTSDYRYSAIVHLDRALEIESASGSMEGLPGYSVEATRALRSGWHKLVHPDDQPDFSSWWLKTLANETVVHEYRILTQCGEVRWLRDYRKPVWSAIEDRVTLIWGAVQDISERKRVEAALVQHAAELQMRNEELDAFAHTVAHDLRNPLGQILGYAHLLADELDPLSAEKTQSALAAIEQAARKMDQMMADLLQLAGIGRGEVKIEPLNMGHIVADVRHMLFQMTDEANAVLVVPDTWPVAQGYGPWIEVVWSNYLSNAVKYGGKPPHIELGATIEREGMVRFWVRDNGPGLTPDDQTRLFVPFTRLAPAVTDGNGVGLSIVQRIVERLGGRIGIVSQAGQGSTFSFSLPRLGA
jgi:PAS domain S-box-containing protein